MADVETCQLCEHLAGDRVKLRQPIVLKMEGGQALAFDPEKPHG